MERKIRKTKHQPIDVAQFDSLPQHHFLLHSGSFEVVEDGKEGEVYKFTKYLVNAGDANPIVNQFGKGTKIYFKYDLRTQDGLLAMNDGEDPNAQFSAQIGNNKTSILIERFFKMMQSGEESWFKMHLNLMHSSYLQPQETNFLFLKIEEIRPVPSFLEPHFQDQRVVDKATGQLVVKKSSVLQKIEAVTELKEYAKEYCLIPGKNIYHHTIALYTKGKMVLGRISKEEKKDPEIKKKYSILLSQLHSNCACFQMKLGQNDKVIAEAKQAITINSENPKGHYWLAHSYAHFKKYEEAVASMKKCVEIKEREEPDDAQLPILRSKLYQWIEAKKKHQKDSVKKSSGFFHKYQDITEKDEKDADQRRKEERKARRLEEEEKKTKEELDQIEGQLDALHLEKELEEGTTELDFN